ncbi:Efflux transporter, RND family, MFP subunit [Polymorphum gilvum SL003B-26A1]|uniref:Efflux transporter, RND family, MFP subunit n=1 Tax=Polymorphum gilvum (strain LMG 25793 / CGMCC 1.9160 / SL003B-26A1) TaxID=991905 RepID=F2IZJ6_POLGS|nr:Efflux transporter, RND family, MFP subunit [Polymorphum gilvum SL003B-26A1]
MSVWKQLVLTLVVVVIAAAIWTRFHPGAEEQLARWGIDWLPFTAATSVPGDNAGKGQGWRAPDGVVITTPVVELTINDRLSAIGTGRAARSVEVRPFDSGRMIELLVQSGATVKAGEVIARLDSEAEEIAAERAAISLRDTEARLERMKVLRRSNTVSDVQVTEVELAVENARLQLREAELALSRRSVETPISGIVGILPIAAGNYVTSQTVIATIDDRSEILVDFWVPERYAAVPVGSPLTATSVARSGETFRGVVSAVDNRIDPDSRTLQVQARIPNVADKLRAGMSFQVAMRFPGDRYPAVDPLAVQWGSDGAFVWAVRDGRAERVAVRIIQRNTDSVLVEASLAPGDEVVTEGLHLVREGAELAIAGRSDLPTRAQPVVLSPAPSGS